MLDLDKVAADVAEEEKMPTPAILINAIATALAGSVVVLALCACRLWRHRRMKAFISELPHASPDGAYLVIAYEWATPLERSFRRTSSRMQSSRLPLESIVRRTPSLACPLRPCWPRPVPRKRIPREST